MAMVEWAASTLPSTAVLPFFFFSFWISNLRSSNSAMSDMSKIWREGGSSELGAMFNSSYMSSWRSKSGAWQYLCDCHKAVGDGVLHGDGEALRKHVYVSEEVLPAFKVLAQAPPRLLLLAQCDQCLGRQVHLQR